MKTLLPLVLLFSPLVTASGSGPVEEHVILDAIAVENLRVETVEAEPSVFTRTAFALGALEAQHTRCGVASSRAPGRVVEVLVHEGDPVRKGQLLARVEARLPGNPPPVLELTAPLDGVVWKSSVLTGQPVEPEAALMEIADLTELFAVARVPDHLVPLLQPGARASVRIPAAGDTRFEAVLDSYALEADAASGTVPARFRLRNDGMRLRPGLRAEFALETGRRADVLAVPRDAVQGDGAARFVFIRHYELPHAFTKVPVVTGETGDGRVEIVKGLLPGDEVVVRGGHALSHAGKGSVSLKEALDAAHGHPHNEDGSEISAEDGAPTGAAPHGHDHGQGWNRLTVFFASTSGILLVLLLLGAATRRERKG